MAWIGEFSTHGRLRRAGFWLRQLVVVPAALWLAIEVRQRLGPSFDIVVVVLLVFHQVSTWGRRLHDRSRSAWWLLLAIVPVAGAVLLLVECGFRGSVPGANRYGPLPGFRDDYLRVTSPATRAALR